MKNKKAKGLKGVLHKGMDGFFFRVYHHTPKRGDFTDYELWHQDLEIIINDDDAEIKQDANGDLVIDYSDETLGR